MKNFVEAISSAETSGLKAHKFESLAGMDPQSQRLVKECLSPYRVFGIKKIALPTSFASQDPGNYDTFIELLDKLADRTLTGNAARDAASTELSKYTEKTATYLRRVLIKKIDCGASATTFNKLYPGLVPVYSVSACKKRTSTTTFTYPKIADAKLDGQRVSAYVTTTNVIYLSRSGKPADFCNGLFDEDLLKLRQKAGYDIVVDTEVMGDNFTETMNAKGGSSKDHAAAKAKLHMYVFDIVPISKWETSEKDSDIQELRTNLVHQLIDNMVGSKLKTVPTRLIHNEAELRQFFDECVALKYEGIIVKDPNARYIRKRGEHWYKWKPVIDLDLVIEGFLPGAPDGMFADTVGAVLMSGKDENGLFIRTECGTGFTIDEREDMKNNPKNWLGKIAEIEVQEITPPIEGRDWYSTRFSAFKRLRDDKEIENEED